jgi:hypothetical protein
MQKRQPVFIHQKVVEQVMYAADERFSPPEVEELHRAFPNWENSEEHFLDPSLTVAADILGMEVEYRIEQLESIVACDPQCDDYVREDLEVFLDCHGDLEDAGLL